MHRQPSNKSSSRPCSAQHETKAGKLSSVADVAGVVADNGSMSRMEGYVELRRDKAQCLSCLMSVSSSPAFRTGLATFTASGSALPDQSSS
jgi:hypothetical protein